MKGHLLVLGVLLVTFGWCISAGKNHFSQSVPVSLDYRFNHSDKNSDNLVVNVELINVLFTVSDRNGKLVTNLNQSNLRLYEDKTLQTITNFSRETDLPLTIALLVDTSTSVRRRFEFEQQAAIDFLHKTLRPKKDKALLIAFDSGVELVEDYTDNPDTLSKAIRQIRPGGGTKMLDAVYLACREKLKAEPGRKLMILISDGDDNMSSETLSSTLEMAQKSDVSIYTVSTYSNGYSERAAHEPEKILKTLAEETGGKAFFASRAEDLSESFEDISQELRSQYSLAYRSSNPIRDGAFRPIKIETDRKNLRVKARKGYYAPRNS
jgi:VWFA-related protein